LATALRQTLGIAELDSTISPQFGCATNLTDLED
jgi:hypothetical protein